MHPKTPEEWQAYDDAHALARAEKIKADPSRLHAAVAAAKEIAEEEAQEAKAMKKIAKIRKSLTG